MEAHLKQKRLSNHPAPSSLVGTESEVVLDQLSETPHMVICSYPPCTSFVRYSLLAAFPSLLLYWSALGYLPDELLALESLSQCQFLEEAKLSRA